MVDLSSFTPLLLLGSTQQSFLVDNEINKWANQPTAIAAVDTTLPLISWLSRNTKFLSVLASSPLSNIASIALRYTPWSIAYIQLFIDSLVLLIQWTMYNCLLLYIHLFIARIQVFIAYILYLIHPNCLLFVAHIQVFMVHTECVIRCSMAVAGTMVRQGTMVQGLSGKPRCWWWISWGHSWLCSDVGWCGLVIVNSWWMMMVNDGGWCLVIIHVCLIILFLVDRWPWLRVMLDDVHHSTATLLRVFPNIWATETVCFSLKTIRLGLLSATNPWQ